MAEVSAGKTVGITGRYCAGKSTAARFFTDRGWREIDADRLGHQALEDLDCRRELSRLFGPGIFRGGNPEGPVDRKALGAVVFAHPVKLRQLEGVVHPWIRRRAQEQAEEAARKGQPAVIHAALLHRMEMEDLCRRVVWVEAPAPVRFLRGLRRDGFHPVGIFRKMAAQGDISPQHFSAGTDIYSVKSAPWKRSLNLQLQALLPALER